LCRNYSADGTDAALVSALILGFIRRHENERPYAVRRTSYGLYDRASCRMPGTTTRLPGAFSPVDPDQRGACPSSGLSPIKLAARGVA
jgi:hypothetical protein